MATMLATACGPGGTTVEPDGAVEIFSSHLEELISDQMDTHDVPGVAVALVREGNLVWSGAFGHADIAGQRQMKVDTVNRTESISKSVTAWGVMILVEEERIDLDDHVVDIVSGWDFPESPYNTDDVTVRQLLSHTSGLPLGTIGDHYPPQTPMPGLEENLSAEAVLVSDPGSGFLYSNVGFDLLELLIEEVSGEGFAAYMDSRVLSPLGMNSSGFEWAEEMAVPTGYDLDGDPVPVYVYPAKASGGLFAPVEDVARFVAAGMTGPYHTDNGVLRQESIRRLYSPTVDVSGIFGFVTESYGLGHFLEEVSGHTAVWHGGQGHGWMTHFHSVPETGDGIVILTNSQRSWPMISTVLDDWSTWIEREPPGMVLIADANVWFSIGVVSISLISLLALAWLGKGLIGGERRFETPFRGEYVGLVQLALAVILVTVLVVGMTLNLWAFFLQPLFPTVAPWLAVSLLLCAATLVVSAWTSPVKPEPTPTRA